MRSIFPRASEVCHTPNTNKLGAIMPLKKNAITALSVVVAIAAILYFGARGWHRYMYPYGWSHCCIKSFLALSDYAHDHNGVLPRGENSPEASLSLLHKEGYGIGAELLRGKTVPLEVTQAALRKNGVAGPASCGWHYVEGLTLADNPQIAVVWDKVGLGHNGERLSDGGHEVLFLSGETRIISSSAWPAFLRNQRTLLAARIEREIKGIPALTAKIRMPSGEIVDHYDGHYSLSRSGENSSSMSGGSSLRSHQLVWYRLDDGLFTYKLSLGGSESKEVEVEVSEGIATPRQLVFEMTGEH